MPQPTRAVLLDALGTLVELEPPFARLAAALGDDVPIVRAEAAMRAEMAYYREHSHEAQDRESLADLRERCARLLSSELGREVTVETMMSAISFRAYADAPPALESLRARGLRLICVSNWDCSLPEVLARVGLGELLDGVVASATSGARKPDPEIFVRGLELAGCDAAEALAVGDTPEEDLAGARAAGIPALLLARPGGARRAPPDGSSIASLSEIGDHLRS